MYLDNIVSLSITSNIFDQPPDLIVDPIGLLLGIFSAYFVSFAFVVYVGKNSSVSSDGHNIDGLCWTYVMCLFRLILWCVSLYDIVFEIADRYNTALVCHRWCFLACHPRLWLRVDRTIKDPSEPGVFPSVEAAISAAKPGETILIGAGGVHITSNIQIRKPLCLVGGGELPEETTLLCSRGSDSALEFFSACKIINLTVKAELGCCLLHRSGRLFIDTCLLQCETNPLDYLSCPIVCMSTGPKKLSSPLSKALGDGVTVTRSRIEGGAKAVLTSGTLVLQNVRVIYGRSSVLYWFEVEHQ